MWLIDTSAGDLGLPFSADLYFGQLSDGALISINRNVVLGVFN